MGPTDSLTRSPEEQLRRLAALSRAVSAAVRSDGDVEGALATLHTNIRATPDERAHVADEETCWAAHLGIARRSDPRALVDLAKAHDRWATLMDSFAVTRPEDDMRTDLHTVAPGGYAINDKRGR